MVADKGKKPKFGEKIEEEGAEQIDSELILSIEKLQEVQDELEKVLFRDHGHRLDLPNSVNL